MMIKNDTLADFIKMLFVIAALHAFAVSSAHADEVIEFPEEELAQESVLPVFDKMEVVKNRRVPTDGMFEIGAGMGLSLVEALYNNQNYNFTAAYNFTDIHGIQLMGMVMADGLSAMGEDLKAGKGLQEDVPGLTFDASLAPKPESYTSLNYQVTAYYGKISLTKEYVINFSLYGLLGATQVKFTDTTSVGLSTGVGQKFYINSWLGFKMDFLLLAYSGPDPTTAPSPLNERVTSAELDDKTYLQTFFNIGLVANL